MSRHDWERTAAVSAADPGRKLYRVVRGFGYDIEHMARFGVADIVLLNVNGRLDIGVPAPVTAECGQKVRTAQKFVLDISYFSAREWARSPWACPHCVRAMAALVESRKQFTIENTAGKPPFAAEKAAPPFAVQKKLS